MGLSFQTSTNSTNVSEKLRIVGSGAATFSSSVTTGGDVIVNNSSINTYSNSYGNNGLLRMYGTDGLEKYQQGLTAGGDFFQYTFSGLNHIFYTSATERMRITSGGQIINTFAGANNPNIFENTGTNPYGPWFKFTTDSNNGTNYYWVASAVVSEIEYVRAKILSNGGLANYQANNTNLSDIRTKKDITPLESYWDKFKAIEMVKFKYKDQTHDDFNIGVIAQQVEKVAPEFIDIDGWGETPKDGVPLKSVYTADLHHATIKVLQEAMSKIETQQCTINTLKTCLGII